MRAVKPTNKVAHRILTRCPPNRWWTESTTAGRMCSILLDSARWPESANIDLGGRQNSRAYAGDRLWQALTSVAATTWNEPIGSVASRRHLAATCVSHRDGPVAPASRRSCSRSASFADRPSTYTASELVPDCMGNLPATIGNQALSALRVRTRPRGWAGFGLELP